MSDLFWLTDEQMAQLPPFFPRSHNKLRVDDRRVLRGIVFVNKNEVALARCTHRHRFARDALHSVEALG